MKRTLFLTLFMLTLFAVPVFSFEGDDFNRTNSGTVGNDWTETSGTNTDASIENNMLKMSDSSTGAESLVYHDLPTAPFQVDVRIKKNSADNRLGLELRNNGNRVFMLDMGRSGQNRILTYNESANTSSSTYFGSFSANQWYNYSIRNIDLQNNTVQIYVNDAFQGTFDIYNGVNGQQSTIDYVSIGTGTGETAVSYVDFITFVYGLNILDVRCVTCDDQTTEPYTTTDVTPTFYFQTNFAALCRISDENDTYADMGSERDCSSDSNQLNHICTSIVEDSLLTAESDLFVNCIVAGTSVNTTVHLEMNVTALDNNMNNALERALDAGIAASSLNTLATVYPHQQVYLRNAFGTEVLGTIDRVVAYGNQRWLLHAVMSNESTIGLFNITPSVYSLELDDYEASVVATKVKEYIDSTKN